MVFTILLSGDCLLLWIYRNGMLKEMETLREGIEKNVYSKNDQIVHSLLGAHFK